MTVQKNSAIVYARISNIKELSTVERLQIQMQLNFAKYYSQTLSESVKRGIRAKNERELAKKLSTSAALQINESKV
jgi:hypothetical protein